MSTRTKWDSAIKIRIPSEVKDQMQKVAGARDLRFADVAREAFRNFLALPDCVALLANGKNGRRH